LFPNPQPDCLSSDVLVISINGMIYPFLFWWHHNIGPSSINIKIFGVRVKNLMNSISNFSL
jgi:hypothetical protein